MIDLTRLPISRMARVWHALSDNQSDGKLLKSLAPQVKNSLAAAVSAGESLSAGRELPALVLDNTTDTVFYGFRDVVGCILKGMDDRVIPLPKAQATKKAAATTLQLRALSDEMAYLSDSMPLQYAAMRKLMDTLEGDKECAAAVSELGLGYFVEHMNAHLAPYGRAVKSADGRDLEKQGDLFHEAFTQLVIDVHSHHRGDKELQQTILGAYQTELAAHREDNRSRKRASKKNPS